MKRSAYVTAIVLLILLLDQSLKIWVKSHMHYGDEIAIFGLDWALLHFVENEGMAFGLQFGGAYGKLLLSLFRIIAVGFLIYYIRLLIQERVGYGLLLSFSLILAGAVGNIFDSAFYGLIFSESPYHGGVAELFPPGGGYAPLLYGKVVDMFYFPIAIGIYPDWFPLIGGEPYLFFKPVFNLADVAISLGVVHLLLFQRKFFSDINKEKADPAEEAQATTDESSRATPGTGANPPTGAPPHSEESETP